MFWFVLLIFAIPVIGVVCLANGEIGTGIILLFASVVIGLTAISIAREGKNAKPTPKPEPKPEPPKPAPEPEPPKPAGKFCRHCGAKLEDGDIYCVECGNKVQ